MIMKNSNIVFVSFKCIALHVNEKKDGLQILINIQLIQGIFCLFECYFLIKRKSFDRFRLSSFLHASNLQD